MRHIFTLAAALALAVLGVASATAAPRVYVGFLDDRSFRWDRDRAVALDAAERANASVVRTIVRWRDVAPRRPRDPRDSWDRAYSFRDVDELVRNAQQRGIEVLVTLWGTPAWANGGAAENVPPRDLGDLTAFAQAVADRYSGKHAGYPFVRFFAIWNEPNSPRFLAAGDRAQAYADLAAAAYAGLKAGSPDALVAAGETAARHAPGAFMQAVARARPDLRFDAWSHHPYPQTADGSPDAPAAWPNVGLRELDRLGRAVDAAFGRTDVPLWVTEYGESTTAVPRSQQARDVARALNLAARVPRVSMFVWLMLRNHRGEPWQSGLVGRAYDAFRSTAQQLDPRNARVEVDPRETTHVFHVPALELKWHIPVRERVGVHYALSACGRTLTTAAPGAQIDRDGWVPVRLRYRLRGGIRYRLDVVVEDVHGFRVHRKLDLVPAGEALGSDACGELVPLG